MSPLTIAIAALILGLVVGSIAVIGAPVFALPIVVAGIALIGLVTFRRRREQALDMAEFREQAKAEKVELTPRDKRTTV